MAAAVRVYFSDFFDVAESLVSTYGAFDISLVNDLPLFIDPFLLFNNPKPEYQELHAGIIRYLRFLRDISIEGEGLRPQLLAAWFTFPEIRQNWLGFSEEGNSGHGLGADFAAALYKNFRTTFKEFGAEVITKSSHLEKLCLVRDGVGRDNLSDFVTNLTVDFLAGYTQEFGRRFVPQTLRRCVSISKAVFNYDTRTWAARQYELPFINDDYVLLTPRDILTKDEAWINRRELLDKLPDIASALPDGVLRAEVNEYLLRVIPRGDKVTDSEVRDAVALVVDKYPQLMDYYIKDKEDTGEVAVSIANERVGETDRRFVQQVRHLINAHLVPAGFYSNRANTYTECRTRLQFLKDIVENKGGHRIFYTGNKPIQKESDLHILYRLTWFGSISDVTREANDGRGPVDFKISQGASDKTLVEFKLAKNTKLAQNLENQVKIYEKASDPTNPSLKVIFCFSESDQLRVNKILKRLDLLGHRDIYVIDARDDNKPSGSVA